ncbi:WXG100 family type VII secretion target [Nocardioides albertanoniae]|uniref:WXG100 family type VII secretion target n=1 Tax=Nocardioides albertanoniae TaxID=1175486 RepID=A0A543ADU9_9ACTN|nr:WXG100 family type VII secretion target [Nocardioides albertanoniae]TQL70720.1 WXG100 family type VII secretion target [Nocardioides albertanoniae]
MSSEIKQGQAINTAVGFIEETKQKLDSINSRTVTEAQSAGSSGWKGAGGTSFQQLMNTYNDKAREITKALDLLTQGLTNARRLGSDADQDVASQSSAIAGQVEGTKYTF